MQGMLMPHTDYSVTVELMEDMLGTVPKDKKLYASFIAEKAKEHAARGHNFSDGSEGTEENAISKMQEEIETVPTATLEDRGWTGFHTDEKGIFVYDYLIRGFLCESARTNKEFGALKQLQDKFKRHCFVGPRRIHLGPAPDDVLERPIRAMTPQGPRVALVRSDFIRAGKQLTFTVTVLKVSGITLKCLQRILSYGLCNGLGQWRSGGWGRIKVVSIEVIHELKDAKDDKDD